jgi:hypothetical protein
MVKLLSPLHSEQARGIFGPRMVFQRRGGKNLLRFQLPQKDILTPLRVSQRSKYILAVKAWNSLSQSEKDFYNNLALQKKFSGYNLYMKLNISGEIIENSTSFFGDRFYGSMIYGNEI